MSVIDTNVLIYDTFEDLDRHKEARNILNSTSEWFVPSVVLIEFIAFLNKCGLKSGNMISKIQELIKHPKFVLIDIKPEDVLRSLESVKEERLSTLRLNDKIILHASKRLRKQLITFDRKLKLQFEKHALL